MKTRCIQLEEKRNVKVKCKTSHVKVKHELNSVNVKDETNDAKKPVILGAKAQLTELPKAKDNKELGPHQFTTRLFNA
jgi:hypothetical protein